MRIAVLCSGNGGNLRAIYAFLKLIHNKIGIKSNLMCIADRECAAINFAKNAEIEHSLISHPKGDSTELVKLLTDWRPDLIITNIHKILDDNYLRQFSDISFNLHYSLLPKYGKMIGENPIRHAYILDQVIGTTLHKVRKQVDAGPIVAQSGTKVCHIQSFEMAKSVCFNLGVLQLITLFSSKFNNWELDKTLIKIEYLGNIPIESSIQLSGLKEDDLTYFYSVMERF